MFVILQCQRWSFCLCGHFASFCDCFASLGGCRFVSLQSFCVILKYLCCRFVSLRSFSVSFSDTVQVKQSSQVLQLIFSNYPTPETNRFSLTPDSVSQKHVTGLCFSVNVRLDLVADCQYLKKTKTKNKQKEKHHLEIYVYLTTRNDNSPFYHFLSVHWVVRPGL